MPTSEIKTGSPLAISLPDKAVSAQQSRTTKGMGGKQRMVSHRNISVYFLSVSEFRISVRNRSWAFAFLPSEITVQHSVATVVSTPANMFCKRSVIAGPTSDSSSSDKALAINAMTDSLSWQIFQNSCTVSRAAVKEVSCDTAESASPIHVLY